LINLNSNDAAAKTQDNMKPTQSNASHDTSHMCAMQFTCKQMPKSFAAFADTRTATHDVRTVQIGVDTPEDANNWIVLLAKVNVRAFAHRHSLFRRAHQTLSPPKWSVPRC
jgi:precorrin isomerase